jgi:broad specificity phosphatase PhoE
VREVEVRRHAPTKKSGRGIRSSLGQPGILQARRLEADLGPFAYVVASDVARTAETAIATGFAVDEVVDMGAEVWEAAQIEKGGLHAHWEWGAAAFLRYAELVAEGGPHAVLARRQAEIWAQARDRIPDGGRALVVSHGGLIEPGVVQACPHGDFTGWGKPFAHLEGVRVIYDGDKVVDVELLRLAAR